MDMESAKALAVVYGNYRAACAVFDMVDGKAAREAAAHVVASAKALFVCQSAFKCEAADTEQVNLALEQARAFYCA
jgi:hypothetical protein